MTKTKAETETISKALASSGLEVISPQNTSIYVSTFTQVERISLADSEERLDRDDPRRDHYIKSIPGYFTTGDGETALLYIRIRFSPLITWLKTQIAFRNIDAKIYLLEFDVLHKLPIIILFCLFFVSLHIMIKRARSYALLSLLPLLLLCFRGGYHGALISCVLTPGWLLFLKELTDRLRSRMNYGNGLRSDRRFARTASVFGLGVISSLVAAITHEQTFEVLHFILWVLISFSLVCLVQVSSDIISNRVQEHKLFFPIFITKRDLRIELGGQHKLFPLFLVLMVVIPLIAIPLTPSPDDVPRPVPFRNVRTLSWDNLHLLSLANGEEDLPNLTHYLTHRAYQQNLLFTQISGFPSKNQEVKRTGYRIENGGVVEFTEIMQTFDQAWYSAVIRDAKQDGIPGLLVEQTRPSLVVRGAAGGQSSAALPVVRVVLIALLALSALAFLDDNLTAQIIYGMRNLPPRRNRQIA